MANILTISIGSMSIKLCEVSYSGNNVNLHKAAVIRTPEGSVEDGFVKNEQAVIDAISASLKINKFEAKTAVFSIFSSRIASKEVMLPDIKEKKMAQLVTANANEYFQINVEEYIITHKSLETVAVEKEKQQRVLVLAAPKELVMSCFNIGYQLGLFVERVDYAGNSVVQLAKREIGEELTMVVHIQEDNSTINILENRILQFQRIVPYGKRMIVEALAEEKDVSEAEAEEMLATDELIHDSFDGDRITDTLRYMINNIARVVDYYTSRHNNVRIEKVCLTGASTELLGIEKLFANEFDFSVTENLPMNTVVIASEMMMPQELAARFIVNLGACISPSDFIPTEEIERVNKETDFKLLYLGMVGAVLIGLVIVLIPLIQYLSAKSDRDNMQKRVDSVIEVEQIMNDYYIAEDKNKDVDTYVEMSKNPNNSLHLFIEDLEDVMPSSVAVNSFSSSSGAVTLSCTGTSKNDAAKFLVDLKSLVYVENVSTTSLSESKDESGALVSNFSVTCTFGERPTNAE